MHVQRYLPGQLLQATRWMDIKPGDIVWCTAASGWSKSARNVFVAPWLRGGTAVIQDARFDAAERLEIVVRERVTVLCMAPTEYRIIAKRVTLPPLATLRSCVAAGEALDPGAIAAWRRPRECRSEMATARPRPDSSPASCPAKRSAPARWAGRSRASTCASRTASSSSTRAPCRRSSTATAASRPPRATACGAPATGRRSTRTATSGSRAAPTTSSSPRATASAPFEIEAALGTHPAVEEAAAVAAPDDERGSVVRAFVVLRSGFSGSDALARELQSHVKDETAPYKYPRRVDFVAALPKTASGKIRRAELRTAP